MVMCSKVIAVVSKVDKKNDIIYVSLKDEHLKSSHLHVQLGYLEHKRPLSPKPPPRDKDFRNNLLCDPAFHNPACVKNLVSVLGIECSSRKSFLESNLGPPYAPEEYAEELRIAQRRRYSIEFTASGVAYMKEGKEKQAKKCFDQALDVHSNNVEALVARGALYANQKGFESAISDFTAALKLNSEHKNAKRYLASTHTAYAKDLEKEGKIVTSLKQYQAALTTDPDHPESSIARERLTTLKGILDRQVPIALNRSTFVADLLFVVYFLFVSVAAYQSVDWFYVNALGRPYWIGLLNNFQTC